MAAYGAHPGDGSFQGLFEGSAEPEPHTSAAAETSFVLGLIALAALPFSITHAVALVAAVVGTAAGVVGMATTSRPYVVGRGLVPMGLLLGMGALLVLALRYLGLDTAVGDAWVPSLRTWLEEVNTLVSP